MSTLPTNGNATPAIPPEAQAQVNGIVEQDVAKDSVAVHKFDPDASPQEKAAQAGKNSDQVKSVKEKTDAGEKELQIDTGAANAVPTITIEDVDKQDMQTKVEVAQPEEDEDEDTQPPGAIPSKPAPTIPDWYRLGWREVGGIDAAVSNGPEMKAKNALDAFLNEQLYGDWYHSAALILITVLVTHFLTRFGFGWGWLFILLAFCNTYYSTSMMRFRRNTRSDIQRELVKTRLMSERESADWMNHFLDRFWLIYEPVLSRTIIATVDQVLSANCPPFLESLRMHTFTLGTKAPRVDFVKTQSGTPEDIVMMDWGFSFTPNDTTDMTKRQADKIVNPKIILHVRVGKGLATAAMPILLEDMSFSGQLRVRMKLMTTFPHVQVVDLSFLAKPVFDYVLKPIGGEAFGFDVGNIPGLSAFIRDTVHSILGPMMYDPNVFTLNLEQMLSGEPLDSAIGVLQVTIHDARGIKGGKLGGGTPDPFISLSLNQRSTLAKTKYKHSTVNPSWGETKFLLVNSLTEQLVLTVWDYNDHRKNTELGTVSFNLSVLEQDATQENIEQPILRDGKDRGRLRFDVSFFPVIKPEVDQAGIEALPDTKVGIVRLTLHQAKDLDASKSMSNDLNPLAKILVGGNKIHTTPKFKHTLNPVWESSIEFLCSDKASSIITTKIIDDRDYLKDPIVGYLNIRLQDLLEAKKKEAGSDWWPLSGCKSGKVRMSAEWKPLNMAGSLHGVDQYVPPIGVVRLCLQKAEDLKNVEAALGGKSDPYVRVQINNVTQGRTEVVNNNLNPEWDQIIYIPVHSLKETMMLECMDYQHLTKDRTLGYVELKVSDLAEAGKGDHPYTSTGKKAAADLVRLDKGSFKGKLYYEAEFIPALLIKGLKFHHATNELTLAAGVGDETYAGDTANSDDGSAVSLSDVEAQAVPEGITVSSPMSDTDLSGRHKKTLSTDTTRTSDTSVTADSLVSKDNVASQPAVSEEKQDEDVGLDLTKEELLKHQSGIIIFNVLSGRLHKKSRLEVLLDDAYWPAFSTVRPRSKNAQWEYIGEGFIKELDFGRVWLRLNEADEGEKDDIVAEFKGSAKDFLQATLDGPSTFTLSDQDDDEKTSTVVIEARYMPVPVTLEPRESVNNQGLLRVSLKKGEEIHGVDRTGKSDPFAVFLLNGQRVYKSQTKKKTLNPGWNEDFVVQVPSRVAADFEVEIFDWNQIEQSKTLGAGKIDLANIEPFERVERVIELSSEKRGNKGRIYLNLVFTPEIIAKSRKNTSTFSTAGRAMTQIGTGAGKGVVHGVTGVFKRDYAKSSVSSDTSDDEKHLFGILRKKSVSSIRERNSIASTADKSIPDIPAGQASHSIGDGVAFRTTSESGTSSGHLQEPGTLRVTVLDAKDLAMNDVKPYVVIRVGDKEQKTRHLSKTATPEWNETFNFSAGPSQPKLHSWIYDHKTLGKDKILGSGDVDIWQHIKPSGVSAAEVAIELREGQGLLKLRLEFDADIKPPRPSTSSPSLSERGPASPSRFSLSRSRRPDRDD